MPPEGKSFEVALPAPIRCVDELIGTEVVSSLLTAVPVALALVNAVVTVPVAVAPANVASVKPVPVPSRLLALAPEIAMVATLDLVE